MNKQPQHIFHVFKQLFVCVFICCALFSCQKEFYSTDASDRLHFSADSIIFDTVFTERGTITHQFKVYNRNKGTVRIDEIYMNQSQRNQFFMNVNGENARSIQGVELAAGDSLFIFIQAKLTENALDIPRLHKDSILFRYNNRHDKIILAAWGQDAHVLKAQTFIENTTWSGRKPYVIFDSLVVDAGQMLTIEEGVKIYVHNQANIIVRGSLQVQGSLLHPVMFTTDRLEESFQTLPGQWGSIIFRETSENNVISYTHIKNAVNGLMVQGNQTTVNLRLENSQITNMTSHGIFACNARIDCFNTVLANCSDYLAAFYGGQFAFTHTTLSNDNLITPRTNSSSVLVSNINPATQDEIMLENSYFRNSIIVGFMRNEITIRTKNENQFLPVVFSNCLLRQTYTAQEAVYYQDNNFVDVTQAGRNSQFVQPLFAFTIEHRYSLDALSVALNKGKLEYAQSFEFDILQHSRLLDQKPDVGAYEFFEPVVEEEK